MSDWTSRAACRGYPVAWFFPPDLGPHTPNRWTPPAEALALCAVCPVWRECDAAGNGEFGLWAGRFRAEKHSQLKRRAREREVARFEADIDALEADVG